MRWAWLLLPVVFALAFLIGTLAPGAPEDPPGVSQRGSGGSIGPILRPGESTTAAVAFMRTLASDPVPPPPPPPPPVEPPPPPPPPPDVSVTFKAALSAISLDEESGAYLVMVRGPAPSGPQTVPMKIGDEFDGWRIGAGRRSRC